MQKTYPGLKLLTDLVKYAPDLGLDPETDLDWLLAMPFATLLVLATEVQRVLLL